MSNIIKPSFTYQPFQDFVDAAETGQGEGPKLIINPRSPLIYISISSWSRVGGICFILEFHLYPPRIPNKEKFAHIVFDKVKVYYVNGVPVGKEKFMEKILEVGEGHSALTDFILWNEL